MYALRSSLRKPATLAGSRSLSSTGPTQPMFQMLNSKSAYKVVKNPMVPDQYTYSVKKAWFSDPSTYPLFAALTSAFVFIGAFSYNALANYKDVRINPQHKHHEIRDWGQEHTHTVAEAIGKRPIGFHARRYGTLPHEGLGVDHEAWKKAKEASK